MTDLGGHNVCPKLVAASQWRLLRGRPSLEDKWAIWASWWLMQRRLLLRAARWRASPVMVIARLAFIMLGARRPGTMDTMHAREGATTGRDWRASGAKKRGLRWWLQWQWRGEKTWTPDWPQRQRV